MSVEYTQGDLLNWPSDITVIAHGANALGLAGAGFAKQVREKYPEAYESYHKWCVAGWGSKADLGTLHVSAADDKRIVWLVTQENVGTDKRQLDYEALYTSLEALKRLLEGAHAEGRIWTLGLPQWIGCGLAGGSPAIVQAIIEHHFFQSPVRCVIVEYVKSLSS